MIEADEREDADGIDEVTQTSNDVGKIVTFDDHI